MHESTVLDMQSAKCSVQPITGSTRHCRYQRNRWRHIPFHRSKPGFARTRASHHDAGGGEVWEWRAEQFVQAGVPSALLLQNMEVIEESMLAAGVDRILVTNTLITEQPGQPPSRAMRFFAWMPGKIGRGAREQQAVVDPFGAGAFSRLRCTHVRGGLNSKGKDEPAVAWRDWEGASNSLSPVSYQAMGR